MSRSQSCNLSASLKIRPRPIYGCSSIILPLEFKIEDRAVLEPTSGLTYSNPSPPPSFHFTFTPRLVSLLHTLNARWAILCVQNNFQWHLMSWCFLPNWYLHGILCVFQNIQETDLCTVCSECTISNIHTNIQFIVLILDIASPAFSF